MMQKSKGTQVTSSGGRDNALNTLRHAVQKRAQLCFYNVIPRILHGQYRIQISLSVFHALS
jgi:hypothetical protein